MRGLFALLALLALGSSAAAKAGDCEVCNKVLGDVIGKLSKDDKKDLVKIETALGKFCEKPPTEKDAKLCYYLDPIKREVSQPVKNGVPVPVICGRLKKKSAEICSLRYAAAGPAAGGITKDTDLSKLRTKDLKAFLLEKGAPCGSCLEKADFERAVKAYFAGGAGGKGADL